MILVGQLPHFDVDPAKFVRWMLRRGKQDSIKMDAISCSKTQYKEQYAGVINMLFSLEKEQLCFVLAPGKLISDVTPFSAYTDGKLLYQDVNHPSVVGAIWFWERSGPELSEILKRQ